jgi:hypothetical protein
MAQKLWSLGMQSGRMEAPESVDPPTYDAVLRPCIEASFEEASIRLLARLEHERWCVDRRLDGWRYAETRNDLARRHPCLVAFDDPRLSAAEIAKDISQVRFVLGALARPEPGGAAARLIMGVVTTDAVPSPGARPADLLRLIEDQPWRLPVLMSPLNDEAEFRAVRDLVETLVAAGRDYRLIVLEAAGARRSEHFAKSAAFAALLASPHCWIAPIGTSGRDEADDWLDPADAAPGRGIMDDYISDHCLATMSPA